MGNKVYNVPNAVGIEIDAYPYQGTMINSQEKEIRYKGVGLTLYDAEVEVDEDGCLFIGLTDAQAKKLARILNKIITETKRV